MMRLILSLLLVVGMTQPVGAETEFILKVENTTPYIIIEMSRDLGYDDPGDMLDAIAVGTLVICDTAC